MLCVDPPGKSSSPLASTFPSVFDVHLACRYMTRLGLWGEGTGFKNRLDFVKLLNARGVGAMELVAIDLKRRLLVVVDQPGCGLVCK